MTPEKIEEVIRAAGDDEPLFVAFQTLLERSLEGELAAAIGTHTDSDERAYDCGRASSLQAVLDEIEGIRTRVTELPPIYPR